MVRLGILDINQQENKLCCAVETFSEVHRWKLHSELNNTPPHFAWYNHYLGTFGCDIYPITSYPNFFDNITQKLSFMGYTNTRATMKWWDPHTKKLGYCSSAQIDEHNNKLGKGCSPGSELIIGTNTYTLRTLKIYL